MAINFLGDHFTYSSNNSCFKDIPAVKNFIDIHIEAIS